MTGQMYNLLKLNKEPVMRMKLNNLIFKSDDPQSLHKVLGIVIALVFSIWGMILRFKTFLNRELWMDETIQMKMSLEPLKPLWLREDGALDVTSFPGDYLLIYPFVKLFGTSKWVTIPHVIVTLLGFYLLYMLCKDYFRTAFGYLVAFVLLCFNDILIFHALEIRPYSVLPTLALACFYFAKDVIGRKDTNKRQDFLVIILFVVTILFHPFGVTIAFVILLFHILNQLKDESLLDVIRRNAKFVGIISAIAILPWIYFVVGIILVPPLEQEVFEYVPNPVSNTPLSEAHNAPAYLVFSGYLANHLMSLRGLYFLLLGMVATLIIKHQDRLGQIIYFFTLIVFPIFCILILDIIIDYWFLPRQYVWVIPLFAFFLGWCWDSAICSFYERSSYFKKQ